MNECLMTPQHEKQADQLLGVRTYGYIIKNWKIL